MIFHKKIVWQNCRKAVTQSYRVCKMIASCIKEGRECYHCMMGRCLPFYFKRRIMLDDWFTNLRSL